MINNQQIPVNNAYNYNSYDNEILKCVMEGMGELASDNPLDNLNAIMDFVKFDDAGIQMPNCSGEFLEIFFSTLQGITKEIKFQSDAMLKEVLKKASQIMGLRDTSLYDKINFLHKGTKLDKNSVKSLRESGIENRSQIIVVDIENVLG